MSDEFGMPAVARRDKPASVSCVIARASPRRDRLAASCQTMLEKAARRKSGAIAALGCMTAEEIVCHPALHLADQRLAAHLIEMHRQAPRFARLGASHRKWLMTQAMYALCMRRVPGKDASGLNATRFAEHITSIGVASRNTADAFLKELLAYKFLQVIPSRHDRRIHVLDTTPVGDRVMIGWFVGHMAALDRMDGGSRVDACVQNPRIFRRAQPRATAALIVNAAWRVLPESIAHFLSCESGGMIVHEFMLQIADFTPVDGKVVVGPVNVLSLAERYGISASNVKRMLTRAQEKGCLGWDGSRGHKSLWLSARFLGDYALWRAQNFAALDEAFHFCACAVPRASALEAQTRKPVPGGTGSEARLERRPCGV